MPNDPRYPAVVNAQTRLHHWSVESARERAERFREARDAGVTPEQIAVITGLPLEVVMEDLGARAANSRAVSLVWA
ncbi:hypothetical protein [Streptacidiphilus jiangxiensis]|uniref:Uncharacterized protein n=1 Tax=Streptacidiphilus jiangxiensis TaxID=235985 RepID=A0A1H7JK71_STRJI|nr:hypothetical protein [Streptacidiphilus jiangxiensis]SEK74981.1 hypothetical protein SAMN05414137_103335 [Streptacidiphilus jiangxiensis]